MREFYWARVKTGGPWTVVLKEDDRWYFIDSDQSSSQEEFDNEFDLGEQLETPADV